MLYMGAKSLNFVNSFSSADDNPFNWPKQHSTSKISVNLSTDKWLNKKLDRLNITLVEGYPSKASEAGGLRDQFKITQ